MHVASLGVTRAQLALVGTGVPEPEEGCTTPSWPGEDQGVRARRKVTETLRKDRQNKQETAAGCAFSGGPRAQLEPGQGSPRQQGARWKALSVALATWQPRFREL